MLVLGATLALSACSGGGGGSTPVPTGGSAPVPTNHAPEAGAGSAQSVRKHVAVTLDGSASSDADGDTLTYAWTQTAGSAVMLSDATAVRPTFTSPAASGDLAFQLVVSDGKTSSSPSIVTITVTNQAPTAALADSGTVAAASTFTLDGSSSSDPDGDPLAYSWTQTSGTTVSLNNADGAHPTFIAPSSPATLIFQLAVSDGEAQSPPVTETVTVQGPVTQPGPTADAGVDMSTPKRSSVSLSGYVLPVSATYQWTQLHGTAVMLAGANSPNPSFTAPAVTGDLVFSLVASSGGISSQPSLVTVHVTNSAPGLANLVLAPSAPQRADAISASAYIQDADQDPLTITYAWKRNGTLVPAATGNHYPTGQQAKGDVIALTVSVFDGTATSTAAASVTIADTPAVISGTAPTTATYGTPLSFSLSASDADGDAAGHFEVAYAPAGFAVSATGAVTWTPSGPMFDRTVDQHWSVRLRDQPTVHRTGTITVNDSTRKYPLVRTNMGIPNDDATIDVADFDGSGRAQALIASNTRLYLLGKSGSDYVQTWAYPFSTPDGSAISAVASGDTDNDGKREIFFAAGSFIVKLDGVNRRETARITQTTCTALKVADIDQDGTPELVCLGADPTASAYQRLYVYNAQTMALKWRTTALMLGTSLAIGNVDGDAALELITNAGYVFDGVTQQNEWAYPPGFGSKVDVGDVAGDGIAKIVGLAVNTSTVTVYSATDKSPLWQLPVTGFSPGFLGMRVDNLDGVGPAEIIVGDAQWGSVYIYRYNTTTHVAAVVGSLAALGDGVNAIGVGDLNGDGNKELVWGEDYFSSGRDYVTVASWTPSMAVLYRGPTPAQLDGDFVGARWAHLSSTTNRAMFLTPSTNSGYDGTRLMALDPATGLFTVSDEIDSNWSRDSAFDVADVTGSGTDAILLGTATLYSSYFTAYDFLSNTKLWSSTPSSNGSSSPNAAAVTHADLTGDGTDDAVTLSGDGHVTVWDVKNQTVKWSGTTTSSGQRVSVADLDGDGVKEIIALDFDRVVVYGRSGSGYLERANHLFNGAFDLLVADVDGDGHPEVMVLAATQAGVPSLFVLDGALNMLSSYPVTNVNAIYLEESGFARKNLVLATLGDSPYIGSPGTTPPQIKVVDPVTGTLIWASPGLQGTPFRNSLSFQDVNGDGKLEMIFGTSIGMFITR